VIAGVTRTALARAAGRTFDDRTVQDLLRIRLRGPIAVRRSDDTVHPVLPRPADALLLPGKREDDLRASWLRPRAHEASETVTMPLVDGRPLDLWLARPTGSLRDKPVRNDDLWTWQALGTWLSGPPTATMSLPADHRVDIQRETRVHVGIDPRRYSSQEGRLFQTTGLRFDEQTGMAWCVDIPEDLDDLQSAMGGLDGLRPMGGERRQGFWRRMDPSWTPDPGQVILRGLQDHGRLRLYLATPASFQRGWVPDWLVWEGDTLAGTIPGTAQRALLRSACIGRWQPLTGWDMKLRRPKPLKRMVPAGSVYFLQLDPLPQPDQGEQLVRQLHFEQSIGPDGMDGFGIVLPGLW